MRTLRATVEEGAWAIAEAIRLGCDGIAWNVREETSWALKMASRASLDNEGWLSATLGLPVPAQQTSWAADGAVDLSNPDAFRFAVLSTVDAIHKAKWAKAIWLLDLPVAHAEAFLAELKPRVKTPLIPVFAASVAEVKPLAKRLRNVGIVAESRQAIILAAEAKLVPASTAELLHEAEDAFITL